MSSPGPTLEFLGQIAYQFSLIQPYIPTYLHLIISALFPIYTGAHASLSRPSSAAKPPKRRRALEESEDEDNHEVPEKLQRMEGLSPSDAILYPVLTGCMLAGLYFLIKWLKDPAILNKILNWYLSVFGIFSIAKLLSDCMSTIASFAFPLEYYDSGSFWEVQRKTRVVESRSVQARNAVVSKRRDSPLPGIFGRLPLPQYITKGLWVFQDNLAQPWVVLEAYVHGVFEAKSAIGVPGAMGFLVAVIAVLYFNLIDKPWWLTNLQGFAFSYSALQLMSPTTFWTGTLVLTSLFFYDIYFVFFTPLMITVATKLDIPVKLLFPRPSGADDDPSKKALSMLGLGDIVLPGIMIGLALRFDLYLFYLKMQEPLERKEPNNQLDGSEKIEEGLLVDATANAERVEKAVYQPATGYWGERFWLGPRISPASWGGCFPKTYFYASVIGYIIGMICTLGVMQVFRHGQPALLYLVPAVLLSLWGTAFVRGDLKTMWEYTEAEEGSNEKTQKAGVADKKGQLTDGDATNGKLPLGSPASEEEDESNVSIDDMTLALPPAEKRESKRMKSSKKEARGRRLFMFSISLPKTSSPRPFPKGGTAVRKERSEVLEASSSPDTTDRPSPQSTRHSSASSVHSTGKPLLL